MAYDVLVTGALDLHRVVQLFDIRKIARDPLSGTVDGANTAFFMNFTPLFSAGSVSVYVGGVFQSSSAYSVAIDTGEVDLNTPPSLQVTASYTMCSLPSDRLARILFAGFEEMEQRFPRQFRLSSSLSSYVAALDTDAHAYIMDSVLVAEPLAPTNGDGWSARKEQTAFYIRCCQYAYYMARLGEEAEKGASYKESTGMSVSTTSRAGALQKFVEYLDMRLRYTKSQIDLAWDNGAAGAAVLSPQTWDYRESLEWQSRSKLDNVRNQSV